MKNRTLMILLVIILVSIIIFGIKIGHTKKQKEDNKIGEDTIGEIENEDYYKEKQEEYIAKAHEYDETLTAYIDSMFREEEKNEISKYNEKLTELANGGDKEAMQKNSKEKEAYIKETSQKRFTKEQLEKLEQIQKRIDELEPIVDEYVEKQVALEEKKFWEGREKLEDGTVINKRDAVTQDKECDGLRFSNIGLKYEPEQKCTKFSAKVTNTSNEVKQGKVSAKTTGDVEMIFPIEIERLEKGEYYSFEIKICDDISMAGTLDIIKYNEKDYQ